MRHTRWASRMGRVGPDALSFKMMNLTEEWPAAPPLSPWRNRDYLLLWSGQVVSLMGTGVSQLVVPLLVLSLTHSPVQAGIAGVCFSLPYLLFSLPAGALLDRWDRKAALWLCGTGCALAMLSVPVAAALGRLTVAQLYVMAALEGTLFVVFNLAETACLPRVIPKSQLPGASARRESAFITADLVAPAVGGFLYGIGRTVPFLAAAAAYAASVVAFLSMHAEVRVERAAPPSRLRAEIMEGLRWLWSRPLIRLTALLDAGRYLVDFGSVLILIVLARHLHASPAATGLVLACGGAGGLLGATVAPWVQRRFRFGQVITTVLWVQAVLWPFFALAPSLIVLGALWTAVALCQPAYDTTLVSYRLALIPDALQGRVNSVFRCIAFSLQPLGAALAGALIELAGAERTVLIFAGIAATLAVAATASAHVRTAG